MGTGTRGRSISTRTCSEALGCESAGRRRVKTKRENWGVDLGDEHYSRRMCDGVVMLTNTAHASGRKRSIPLPWLSFCIEENFENMQNESHVDRDESSVSAFVLPGSSLVTLTRRPLCSSRSCERCESRRR